MKKVNILTIFIVIWVIAFGLGFLTRDTIQPPQKSEITLEQVEDYFTNHLMPSWLHYQLLSIQEDEVEKNEVAPSDWNNEVNYSHNLSSSQSCLEKELKFNVCKITPINFYLFPLSKACNAYCIDQNFNEGRLTSIFNGLSELSNNRETIDTTVECECYKSEVYIYEDYIHPIENWKFVYSTFRISRLPEGVD